MPLTRDVKDIVLRVIENHPLICVDVQDISTESDLRKSTIRQVIEELIQSGEIIEYWIGNDKTGFPTYTSKKKYKEWLLK